jgi:hypothetical protein
MTNKLIGDNNLPMQNIPNYKTMPVRSKAELDAEARQVKQEQMLVKMECLRLSGGDVEKAEKACQWVMK